MAAIENSLRRFGQVEPLVVQAKTRRVIGGNGRLAAMKKMGWTTATIALIDVDDATATALSIALNRTAELAEWDDEVLAGLLGSLDADLQVATGFDDAEIQALISDAAGGTDGLTDPDAVPEQPPAITQRGDVWVMGKHRLICGDSTNAVDVNRLMGAAKADMMFTDPPYGVDYSGGIQFNGDGTTKTNNREKLAGDGNGNIYLHFLPVAVSRVDGPCYVWFAGSKPHELMEAIKNCDCEIHAMLIWNKINAKYAALNAQYKQRHEPLLYFKPKGSTLRWCGPTDECTVWDIKRDSRNDLHPTQKPVELAERAIGNHDAKTVLDAFCGSGSTIIAAEKLGRRCFAIEIEPRYVDVAVQRWCNFTGKDATRESDGAKWSELSGKSPLSPEKKSK